MMQHEKYKPSDLLWLSQIPHHWEIKRVKNLGEYQSGEYINANEFDEGNQYPVYGGNSFRGFASKFNVDGEYVLIGRQGALCGNINYGLGKFWATEHCVVVYHKRKINVKWLGELLRVMNLNQYATSTAQPGLSVEKIKRLELPYPPFTEQTAIAQYLDAKTQAIYKKINLLTQKAETYKELRKSIINEAVCKGLDKKVKLKESEVGINPTHWRIGRLKDISKTMSSGATPHTNISAYYENGILNWVNTGDLNDGVINDCQYKISAVAIRDYPNLKLNKIGTLLIAMYGATICKIGLLNIEATTNQACCCINFKKENYSKFIFYWFLANKSKIISLSVGGTQPNISQGIIAKLLIAIPPLLEQTAIANYLDEKTQKIDAIVTNIAKQIDTLKELRKTLINDVVTGKIMVNG